MKPLKVVILTTDKREHFRNYQETMPSFGTAPEALLQGLALIPEVEIHVISCLQKYAPAVEKLAPNIWYHGLPVPKAGWLRTGYQGCIRAVRKKLQELKPDVVHGQGTERDCAISAVLSGYPNVLTIHGNMQVMARMPQLQFFTFSYYWLAAKLERFCLARTNGVVCITNYTRCAVSDLAHKTWIIPNAVDESFFEIAPQLTTIPEILYVGNICLRKNQNAFIRAMDGIPEIKERQIFFLGSKEPNDSYAHEFDQLVGVRPWCRFEGMADREKLKEYFSRASLLVLASLEDNCPMVVLEAMAAGVPVVAGAVGGVPELIENGITGLLCDPTSEESIQSAIRKNFRDMNGAQQMSRQARDTARHRFHPLAIAQQHLEIYHDVLESSGNGRN